MFSDKLLHRTVWPTMMVAVILLGASMAAAALLQREQARTAGSLRENVSSRTVAQNLETALEDLVAILRRGGTEVDGLIERIRGLLDEANGLADKDEERLLADHLMATFDKYAQAWEEHQQTGQGPKEAAVSSAIRVLETEALPLCRRLRAYNGQQIEQSEEVHAETVRWMAWGLAGVGVVGALGGILLGYAVARGLRRSIYQLSVRIQDAADRLGTLPPVTLSIDGDLPQLHGQMEKLVQDIERMVQQLQQRERELLRAEQLKMVGQLAAGAAHELRNPLTAIKMLIQTNREEAAEHGLPAEDLDVIEGEVRRMERCLHTFLDFARPPQPDHHPIHLASVVAKSLALLGGRAHQRVTLRFAQPASAIVVDADPEQIQQVLVNLVLNALDAMPEGGNLDVEICPSVDEQVSLCVCDTGPGIPPQLAPRLFEPFVSSKETGLGLGLVVSRRIAEAHGGSLGAANRPEGGACFELRLPVAGPVTTDAMVNLVTVGGRH